MIITEGIIHLMGGRMCYLIPSRHLLTSKVVISPDFIVSSIFIICIRLKLRTTCAFKELSLSFDLFKAYD